MTIEEKAKAYDEAIRKAKITLGCCDSASIITEHTIYDIFPELSESEDERIRKSIISIINNYVDNSNTFKPKMLTWLEKQKKVEIDDDDLATLENWESIVKENKDKWQLSDWFIEATSMLINKVKNMDISGNKTMFTARVS